MQSNIMPLSDLQSKNSVDLWGRMYPHLAPNLGDPMKLKGMADLYRTMAMRAETRANTAGVKDYSTRALQAQQALRELYGVDY